MGCFSKIGHQGRWQLAHKQRFIHHLSVSLVPDLGKNDTIPPKWFNSLDTNSILRSKKDNVEAAKRKLKNMLLRTRKRNNSNLEDQRKQNLKKIIWASLGLRNWKAYPPPLSSVINEWCQGDRSVVYGPELRHPCWWQNCKQTAKNVTFYPNRCHCTLITQLTLPYSCTYIYIFLSMCYVQKKRLYCGRVALNSESLIFISWTLFCNCNRW